MATSWWDLLTNPPLLATWWAALLVAALVVSVPLIIHLWRRQPIRAVAWGPMHLLRAAVRPTARRAAWEERALLLLRLGAVAALLVALVLVQPWWRHWLGEAIDPAPGGHGAAGLHRILVIDVSLSMSALVEGEPVLDRAVREARRGLIEPARAGDAFSLVVLDAVPHLAGPAAGRDRDATLRELDEVRPTHGAADLPGALRLVADLLDRTPAGLRHEVYFLTDAHAGTWAPAPPRARQEIAALLGRLQERAWLALVDLGSDRPGNGRLTGLNLENPRPRPGEEAAATVTVQWHGGPPPPGRGVFLALGPVGAAPEALPVLQRQPVTWAADGPGLGAARFSWRWPGPGTYHLQARLEGEDGLPADDAWSQIVVLPERLGVCVVAPPAAPPEPDEAHFLRRALANPRWGLRLWTRTPEELAREPVGGPESLEAAACVVLANVPRLGEREAQRLDQHLRRGGGLLAFLGDRVEREFYNAHLCQDGRGCLPVVLGPAPERPADPPLFLLDPGDYGHPLVREFRGQPDAGLLSARFWHYQPLRVPAAGGGVEGLYFRPEHDGGGVRAPALVTAARGPGRVVVWATGANLRESTWPLNASFVPLVQEAFQSVIGGRFLPPAGTVGHGWETAVPGPGPVTGLVEAPDGATLPLVTTPLLGGSMVRLPRADLAGLYRLRWPGPADGAAGLPPALAVNPDPADPGGESDPARVTVAQLDELYPGVRLRYRSQALPPAAGLPLAQTEWSWHLLLAALALLVAELLLAGRLARTAAAPPADAGRDLRTAVGLGLIVLPWAVGGLILGQYLWSGDLLRFLPGGWRSALEGHLDLPPAAGEGRAWQLRPRWLGPVWGGVWPVLFLGVAALAYLHHRQTRLPARQRLVLALARLTALTLLLAGMLPGWDLAVVRQAWPEILLAVDTSASMATADAGRARLDAVRHALGREDGPLEALLGPSRPTRVRLARVGAAAQEVGEFLPGQVAAARQALAGLTADSPASRLGDGLRQLVAGRRVPVVVLFSDGAVTEGEPLADAAAWARGHGTAVYLVGVGRPEPPARLHWHDLRASATVYARDVLVLEARLDAEGAAGAGRAVRVTLTEKGKDVPAATQELRLAGPDVAAVVRLEYRPAKAGETTLVLEARAVGGEPALAPALVEHRLQVLDPQRLRCLLIEGGPRYEYRYLKALLGRQTEPETGRPSIDLQVLLGDADPGFAGIDAAARAGWPGPRDLAGLDLVILGDVDPARIQPGDLEALRDQVRQGGTGLIVLGGPHFQPNAYRGTALAEVLPIELPAAPRPAGDAEPWLPQPTPAGRAHPLFRDWPDDAAGRLPPLVAPPETAPARSDAVVLATHPRGGRPVALERRYGAGRCVYLGFAETWRWQGLDLEPLYARFWLQLLRHAARQRPTRPLLTLDRPPPYRRGEGLTLLVHDPADRPADGRRWLVVRPPDGGPPRVEALQAVPGSFGVWQWRIDHLEEGAYRFALGPRPEEGPTLECQVLGPPTEADRTALDEAALRAAAAAGGGAYFPLEKADDLWDRLPPAGETPLGPAWETPVWDHPYLWLLILGLLGGEWAWRRRQGLP